MEEVKMNIPDGWEPKSIIELIKEKPKSKLKVSDATNYGEYPFFTSGEAILLHKNFLVENENIFLATGGLANVKYFKGKSAYSTDTYTVDTEDDYDTKYLYYNLLNILYYINSNYFLGSGLKHLQKKDFKAHQLIIPKSKTEQQKITQILTKVDEAIAKTENLITKYQRIKTGLMQDLLTKGIDKNGNIRNEETHQFKDSPLGRIPVEWDPTTIGGISQRLRSGVTPKGGSNVYQEEGIMLIRSQNVYSYGFKIDDVAFISDEINNRMLGSQLEKFDVLLNITGASIGRSTYVPDNFPKANVNQHVCSIRLQDTNVFKAMYVSTYLNSEFGQIQIEQYNAGSNREGINYTQIKEIRIPSFKDENEYEKFYNASENITSKVKNEQLKLEKLKSVKTGLMQDLLSGKKRVTHLLKE